MSILSMNSCYSFLRLKLLICFSVISNRSTKRFNSIFGLIFKILKVISSYYKLEFSGERGLYLLEANTELES
jgi:hypothetical protein